MNSDGVTGGGTSGKALDWDARWAASGELPEARLYGGGANLYLRAAIAWFGAPKTALFLADGDGRNSQWLAGLGAEATAVDLSGVACERARGFDRAAGVSVERIAADLGAWTPPADRRWDAVALLYLQAPPEIRERAVVTAASALAPGGWLLLEGFSKAQASRQGLGPDDPTRLYALDELIGWLPGLSVIEALEGEVRLDEGPRHQGLARVVRLLARRLE